MTIAIRISAILILFCCALLIATYPVWAQDATPGGTRRERVQQRVETIKEKLATREAALKERLAKFRDKKKAEIVERVSSNLNRINERYTQAMLRFLDNASRILSRLEDKVGRSTPDIKDPVAARGAIADAKTAIDSARSAIQAQAEKDYTPAITSEGKARTDVKAVRDGLHADLRAVREQVINAKQAVANAIRVAKSGKLEIPGKEATQSGQ